MSRNRHPPTRRDNQSGQALVLVPLMLLVLLGICALVLDVGNVYVCYQQLQSATNAAALAGGAAIPSATAVATASQFSGVTTTDYNHHPNMTISAVGPPTLSCVNPATFPGLSLPPCQVYGTQVNANVIKVIQAATVPTYFAKIFGVATVNIKATAIASASGGSAPPYNIMLVLDTTASMGTGNDSNCVVGVKGGSYTPEQCAQNGIQTLLGELSPCSTSLSTCPTGSGGLGANAVDEVGLMVFPGLCSSTGTGVTTNNCPAATSLSNTTANSTYAPKDTGCPSTSPPIASYNNNPEYLVVPLTNNFRTSDVSAALNAGSSGSVLVNAVGAGTGYTGATNCAGVQSPGGEGTFYAGVIQAAQDYLTANTRTGAQNVMITLSDGDATATSTQMGGTVKQGSGPSSGTVYSATNECQQAINAANAAKTAGTIIYSISYGSGSSGCASDGGKLSPCTTMASLATGFTSTSTINPYFFSVPNSKGGTTCSGATQITQLSQVFTTIAGDLTNSRLLPPGLF